MKALDLTTVMGTETIQACTEEITKEQYCNIRGWLVPEDEDPEEMGRLVVYPQPKGKPSNVEGYDGYVSWSPAFAFDEAYRTNGNLTFGHAIEAIKSGERVARVIWEEGFIFKQIPAAIKSETVPKMQSLPESVKDYFDYTFNSPQEQTDAIYYDNQIAIVGLSNLVSGYSASAKDILAEDWMIL